MKKTINHKNNMDPEYLNPKATPWRPSFVLRPPSKPLQIVSIPKEKPFHLIEFMEHLYGECERRFVSFTLKKVYIRLNYHPNFSKRADEAFLTTSHPAIRITIRENEYFDFYCVDELIWPDCHVGFRSPLGSNLFHWSVKDIYEVLNGMDRLIKRSYPDIFHLSLYSNE